MIFDDFRNQTVFDFFFLNSVASKTKKKCMVTNLAFFSGMIYAIGRFGTVDAIGQKNFIFFVA